MFLPKRGAYFLCRWTKIGYNARSLSFTPIRQENPINKSKEWALDFFVKNAFAPELLDTLHKKDQLPRKDWVLIYNDGMSRGLQFRMKVPLFVVSNVLCYVVYSYYRFNAALSVSEFTSPQTGIYHISGGIFLTFVLLAILAAARRNRIGIRTFRIYQNVEDPTKYKIFHANGVLFTKWVETSRNDINARMYLEICKHMAENPDFLSYSSREEIALNLDQQKTRRPNWIQLIVDNKPILQYIHFFKDPELRAFMLQEVEDTPEKIDEIKQKLLESVPKE